MTAGPIRVLVVDDQAMVRQGFSALLAAQPEIEVVGDAANGADAVAAAGALTPDVVLMDIRMPVMDGIEATRRILINPLIRVLVLTSTTTSTRRCGPEPAVSCSRTPARKTWCRPSGWWPQTTASSPQA